MMLPTIIFLKYTKSLLYCLLIQEDRDSKMADTTDGKTIAPEVEDTAVSRESTEHEKNDVNSPSNKSDPPRMVNRKSNRYVPMDGEDGLKPLPRDRPVPLGVNVTPHPTIEGKYYVDDVSLVRDQIIMPLYADQGGYYVYRAQVNNKGDKK